MVSCRFSLKPIQWLVTWGNTAAELKMTHQSKPFEQLVLDGSVFDLRPSSEPPWLVGQGSISWMVAFNEESQSHRFLWNHGHQTVQTECQTAKIGLGRVELYEEETNLSWFHGVTVSGVILESFYRPRHHGFLRLQHGVWSPVTDCSSDSLYSGVTESVSMQSSPNTPHWNWNDYTVTWFPGATWIAAVFEKWGDGSTRAWHWCVSLHWWWFIDFLWFSVLYSNPSFTSSNRLELNIAWYIYIYIIAIFNMSLFIYCSIL